MDDTARKRGLAIVLAVVFLDLLGSVVAWTVFGLAEALWLLFLARMLAGAMGGNLSTAQAYVVDVTPPERRATALGYIGAAFGLGFIFGPGIGAVLSFDATIAAVGYWAPFVVGSLLLLPVIALVARLGRDIDAADARPADPGHAR